MDVVIINVQQKTNQNKYHKYKAHIRMRVWVLSFNPFAMGNALLCGRRFEPSFTSELLANLEEMFPWYYIHSGKLSS